MLVFVRSIVFLYVVGVHFACSIVCTYVQKMKKRMRGKRRIRLMDNKLYYVVI